MCVECSVPLSVLETAIQNNTINQNDKDNILCLPGSHISTLEYVHMTFGCLCDGYM